MFGITIGLKRAFGIFLLFLTIGFIALDRIIPGSTLAFFKWLWSLLPF